MAAAKKVKAAMAQGKSKKTRKVKPPASDALPPALRKNVKKAAGASKRQRSQASTAKARASRGGGY